jgi:hypothetical protein
MSLVNNKELKPKAKKSKQKQEKKVIQDDKKTQYTKLSSMSHSNQSADIWKYVISCRSCFWGTPFVNYNRSKTKTNNLHAVCPSCASKNIGYLSIPDNGLFNYISNNIN